MGQIFFFKLVIRMSDNNYLSLYHFSFGAHLYCMIKANLFSYNKK